MVLDDIFERFAEQSPVTVMARAALEHALDPRAIDALFEEVAERQYTRTLALLHGRGPDGHRRLQRPARHPRRLPGQRRVDRRLAPGRLRQDRPHRAGPLGGVGPPHRPHPRAGHHGHGRRAAAWLPGYPVKILDGNHLAGTEHRLKELRHHRGRGAARPRPGRARPAGDAGHRRVPVRGRPRPGAVAAGSGPGDDPVRRGLDRRPQLLHDGVPLRHRPAWRVTS